MWLLILTYLCNNMILFFSGKTLKVGQEVRGVVLCLDVAQKQVELSLRSDVIKHVSRIQGLQLTFFVCYFLNLSVVYIVVMCIYMYFYFQKIASDPMLILCIEVKLYLLVKTL